MKIKLFITVALVALSLAGFGQQDSTWNKWSWILGEWYGEGSGKPGQGEGVFTFAQNLDGKVLIRKSRSEYPATENKPYTIHEDLMIIYLDYTGIPSKAIYFDNEGHTINYAITYAEKSIILTSEAIPSVPTFRLTYTLLTPETVNTKFEMSRDGQTFFTYIEGKSKKK